MMHAAHNDNTNGLSWPLLCIADASSCPNYRFITIYFPDSFSRQNFCGHFSSLEERKFISNVDIFGQFLEDIFLVITMVTDVNLTHFCWLSGCLSGGLLIHC